MCLEAEIELLMGLFQCAYIMDLCILYVCLSFSYMVSTPEFHKIFINSVIVFLCQYGFDGLNLDWQYPGSSGSPAKDKHLFTVLVQVSKR